MQIIVVLTSVFYFLAAFFIFAFSMVQLSLIYAYMRKQKNTPLQTEGKDENLPTVTVQLPLYNERYVAERLIDCVAELDYPAEKLLIQVLDDSTDDTAAIVANKVKEWQSRGINIQQVLREKRTGFKAGALAYGLEQSTSELVAIFDADFLPPRDFLRKTIPYFQNPKIGMVQTRWGHINESYSFLTRLQAFGLNGHFIVEQSGRNKAGSFINFNGTGGVWRRACIDEAGGWSADTLTEDLDLSFRAQMKGWEFHYAPEIVTPAELPVIMSAIKSQQYRWNKGGAETARKHLIGILLHRRMSIKSKIHALFHLISSSVFVGLFITSVLSLPVLIFKESTPLLQLLVQLGGVFTIGFLSIGLMYWISATKTSGAKKPLYYWKTFPLFIALCMGLSLHNSVAVIEGWLGVKSPFIRTPKFNIQTKNESWAGNVYVASALTPSVLVEGILALYFLGGVAIALSMQEYLFMIFMLLPMLGFFLVFSYSLTSGNRGIKG